MLNPSKAKEIKQMTQIPNSSDYELMKAAGELGEQAAEAVKSGAGSNLILKTTSLV